MGYLCGRLRSIGFALNGVRIVIASQPNARLHLFATVLVVVAAFLSRVTLSEWALLVFAIAAVWAAEALNTAIEFAVDLSCPEKHPLAQRAKDAAAGAVLLASVAAVLIGLIVFLPKWL